MEPKVAEIAERVRSLRESEGYTQEQMADATGTTFDEYVDIETGNRDFSFTFLYKCAKKLNVDMVELLTGEAPKLTGYTVVRSGKGLPMKRREGFRYSHLASNFKHKTVEPFFVHAPYNEDAQNREITLSTHEGQEFDYIIDGNLKFRYGKHIETLGPGDSVFYDSGNGHGMIATDKKGCNFLAIIIKKETVN